MVKWADSPAIQAKIARLFRLEKDGPVVVYPTQFKLPGIDICLYTFMRENEPLHHAYHNDKHASYGNQKFFPFRGLENFQYNNFLISSEKTTQSFRTGSGQNVRLILPQNVLPGSLTEVLAE